MNEFLHSTDLKDQLLVVNEGGGGKGGGGDGREDQSSPKKYKIEVKIIMFQY